jgi:signal transduction histidine kinase
MDWVGRFSLCLMLLFASANAAAAEPKRVLLLHSFGPQFVPWVYFSGQFREELMKRSPEKPYLYEASLESARFQHPEEQEPFVDYLRSLFGGRDLDLIVAMGAPATFFVQRYRQEFFPSTPMIIASTEQRGINSAALTANDTTVATTLDFGKWIESILQVLPQTEHIAWAVGGSPLERFWTQEFRRTADAFADRVTYEWFNDLTFEDMLKRVSSLPPRSAIYYVDLRMDAAGVPLEADRLARLHQVANAPIFSYVDSYLGQGIVGGPLLSSKELGRRIASVAVRILGGEQAGNITTPPLAMGASAYDWRELNRWKISASRLPPGSQILFREPGLWEQYWLQILLTCGALLAQTALIIWLISEQRRRQQAEIQSRNSIAELTYMDRRAAAGQLSATLTHEIIQPLTGIAIRAEAALRFIRAEKPDLEKTGAALQAIVAASHRAGEIVTSVRAMFKKAPSEKVPTNINQIIVRVLSLVRIELLKHHVHLQTQLNEHLPTVQCDKVQLQQVVLNLIMNGIEAMRSVQTRVLKVQTEQTKPSMVRVSIEDTGPGIDPSNLDQIFKPLFTTKASGMGMGLSICRSIIESHGGQIWVSATVNGSSIFQFELPISSAEGQVS